MVKSNATNTIAHDPSSSCAPRMRGSYREWSNFMSPNIADMYNKAMPRESARNLNLEDEEMDMKKILKSIERLGSSAMTWKERKKLENTNVVSLGGKPIKSHRIPLSVAKPMMKNKKKREDMKMEEEKLLGVFTKRRRDSRTGTRRPEDRVLKATEGYFNKGVLNVKHLMDQGSAANTKEGFNKKAGNRKNGKGGRKKRKGRRKGH